MRSRAVMLRGAAALILGIALFGLSGCTNLQHRWEDALDMIDVGVTFTKTPQIAVYKACSPVFAFGYGKVDGSFLGLGGGQVGLLRHHLEGIGLALWGEQRVAFGEFDLDDPRTLNHQRSGPLGKKSAPYPGPEYMLCCVDHLHLGWIGVVLNARWLQMADFALGWFGADICHDDGKPRGEWPKKTEAKPGPSKPRLAEPKPTEREPAT